MIVTQISGSQPGDTALLALKDMLTHMGAQVAHPITTQPLFCKSSIASSWDRHDNELAFYESIANSTFHIVYDGPIDNQIGIQILYAMLKNRPIIATGPLRFADYTSPYVRSLIMANKSKLYAVSLRDLDIIELDKVLTQVQPASYKLSHSDRLLINSRVKSHFRALALMSVF